MRPGWIPTLAAILGLALTLSAAYWQFGRAQYKTQLSQDYSRRQAMAAVDLNGTLPPANEIEYRKVTVTGVMVADKAMYLDNKVRAGAAGYEYIVPMRVDATDRIVLVNRGWLPIGPDRRVLPHVRVPTGTIRVSGNAVFPGRGALELSKDIVSGSVWQNVNLDRYREYSGLDVMNFVVQEASDSDDEFNREWPMPGFGVQTHQSYSVQWLFFATLIVFFYVYYGFIRKPRSDAK